MKQQQSKDSFNAGLSAFQIFNPLFPTGGKTWAEFWHQQEKMLNSMQDLSDGWFERRYLGTAKARDAAKRASEAESAFDVMREIQLWALGSLQRVAEDCLACHCHMTKLLELATPASAHADDAATPVAANEDKAKRAVTIPAQAA